MYTIRARHVKTNKYLYLVGLEPHEHWHFKKAEGWKFEDKNEADAILGEMKDNSLVHQIEIVRG